MEKDHDLCPVCGNEIHFDTIEMVDGHAGFFNADCDCGFSGRQWITTKFEHWQKEINGEYIDMEGE